MPPAVPCCAVACHAALCADRRRVDSAIQQFTPYLTAVAQTGQCDTVKEAGLLQLIADNSLLYTDVVTKIGLLDISPTAWKHDKWGPAVGWGAGGFAAAQQLAGGWCGRAVGVLLELAGSS